MVVFGGRYSKLLFDKFFEGKFDSVRFLLQNVVIEGIGKNIADGTEDEVKLWDLVDDRRRFYCRGTKIL